MPSRKKTGTPLVIVESPAKAKTIGKFLGPGYRIEASIGHIRDLPSDATEIPAAIKKEKWARLGIDVESDFKPIYVVPHDKRDHMKKLKAALKEADVLYLATDEDREGESISWHLVQELQPTCEVKRMVFHEITKDAIQEALQNPRDIDQDLVEAQETRRIVDRLYGYTVSPLLWKKVKPRLSAGRVQSVAVRLLVEREQARMRFKSAEYWSLEATFAGRGNDRTAFAASLRSLGGKDLAAGKDFDPDTGKLTGKDKLVLDGKLAHRLAHELQGRAAKVLDLEQKPFTERPSAPFTTSTLQQEASRKLRFGAQRTMRAAQRLYENGYITYMRTDSTTLSSQAVAAARKLIAREYGGDHLPDAPRTYATKVRNAQEAHEAIRPAGGEFMLPGQLGRDVGEDERRVYELIFRRTVACQMRDARGQATTMRLGMDTKADGQAVFVATGRVIEYPGFRLAYIEADEDAEAVLAEADRVLPALREGEQADNRTLAAEDHFTQPPARLTEASLIKELEKLGIGRPSTYASIIETILAREYCFRKATALVPTFTAFAVVGLMREHLRWLVDFEFTAKMEEDLDEISNGRARRLDYLKTFFLGNGKPGLRDQVGGVADEIDPRVVCSIPLGKLEGETVEVRVGRYGPFLSHGERRVSVPDETAPDEMTLDKAIELLDKGGDGPKCLGNHPDSGLPVYVKVGRFGPYFQLGDAPEKGKKGAKPKMASLLKSMDVETVTLAEAVQVLSLPRSLGAHKHPETGEEAEIFAQDGRFGPYLKWGTDTRSIPPEHTPLSIDTATALQLFAQPKPARGGRGRAAPKVLREVGVHPESKAPIRVLDGRYGPYLTDGTTNASVPKGEDEMALDLARAVELLRAREGAPTKKRARKPGGRKRTRQ